MNEHTNTPARARLATSAIAALLLLTAFRAEGSSLAADYQFQNNLSNSAAPAADLSYVGIDHSFQTENVFGTTQTVLTFSAGSGVELVPTTSGLLNPGIYTIAFTARVHNSATYSKYVDFANGTLNAGLYNYDGVLSLHNSTQGAFKLIGYDYENIALTRDSSGKLCGYVNGALQFAYDDSLTQYGVIDGSNTLRFFVDDGATGTEQSDGAIARLRIYYDALSEQAIAALENYTTPPLVADYAGSLTSTVGGAPGLATIGAGVTTTSETVLYYAPPQPVLAFTAGSGFSLSPVSTILPAAGRYTIALQARLGAVSGDGYSKLIDFANATADVGVYDYLGRLEFYSYGAFAAGGIVLGTDYGDIVLTRDKSGAIAGYYKGLLQFWTTDAINGWGIVSPDSVLRFFVDDTHGAGTENSSGAVARIRVWTDALSAEDVRQLTDSIFHDGFEP
jgi:hypothetical protein